MNDADCARPATHAPVPPWTASAPWVLGLLAVWLLATAGLRPLLLPDEARYAEVAREMLAGDGWVPLLNGLPFFHKPPLTYWIDLGGMRLFGITPFAARLGPALGAWLMGAALWLWLRQRQGARTAGIALVVLATSPFVYIGGQYANHDMLVAGTITAAVLCLARALDCRAASTAGVSGGAGVTGVTGGTGALRWLVAGWVACGLAVLSKGLIGVVLPALIVGPWLLWQRRWRDVFWLLHPLGLAAFAVVALPWMLLMQGRYPGFFDYFIVEQHFRRYATLGFNNQQPAWFLIAVLPLLTLPWSAAALPALRRLWPGGARAPAPPGAGGMTGLMVWWVVAVLGFFSLPASKLVGYIMPALAPWCLLLAAPLAADRRAGGSGQRGHGSGAGLAGAQVQSRHRPGTASARGAGRSGGVCRRPVPRRRVLRPAVRAGAAGQRLGRPGDPAPRQLAQGNCRRHPLRLGGRSRDAAAHRPPAHLGVPGPAGVAGHHRRPAGGAGRGARCRPGGAGPPCPTLAGRAPGLPGGPMRRSARSARSAWSARSARSARR